MILLVAVSSAFPGSPALAASDFPNSSYALIFFVDGIPRDTFRKMLEDGELPNFKKHIYDRGIYSENHVTVFPSVTFPSLVSIFSGRYPSGHHIPDFFWVDRNEDTYKNYISIDFGDYSEDAGQNVYLLFEYFPQERTFLYALPLNIGENYSRTLLGSYVDIFREQRDLDSLSKAVQQRHALGVDVLFKPYKLLSLLNPSKETNVISLLNPFSPAGMFHYAFGSLSGEERYIRQQVPAAVLYYDWSVNHDAYEAGPESQEVHDALVADDTQFGRIAEAYQEAGLYDQTYFFLLSDHGSMKAEPKFRPIDRLFVEQGFRTRRISHELIARAGISNLVRTPSLFFGKGSIESYNCILGTSGGGAVVVFLSKDGGTCAESWQQQVYYRDLLDYPVTPGQQMNIEEFINSIDGVNFFLVRESPFLEEEPHETRIVSPHGTSMVSSFYRKRPVSLKYEVLEGTDPLGYEQDPVLAAFIAQGYHDDREWLQATVHTDFPDALVQIAQYMENPRSGSVVIIPQNPVSFDTRTWAKHGGLSSGEMLAVFAASGPGIRHGTIPYSRTVDFTPTFLHLMGKDAPQENFDGIILKDILSGEQ